MARYGSHAERGILTRTATRWYFAEGATLGNFNLFYLIQNPNAQTAQVKVTYLLPTGAPLVETYTVLPQSRFNIWVDDEGRNKPALARLANAELSAIVESTNGVPIIAERAMYLDQPGRPLGAGHESAGVTAPSTQWFLAEGATGNYFDLFILIANPNAAAATVQADFLLTSGQVITKTYTVAGNSRFNIWVDLADPAPGRRGRVHAHHVHQRRADHRRARDVVAGPDVGRRGRRPTTARARPRRARAGRSPKVRSAGRARTETYVLIANTSPVAGTIRATVLFDDGSAPVAREFAHQRQLALQHRAVRGLPRDARQEVRDDRRERRRRPRCRSSSSAPCTPTRAACAGPRAPTPSPRSCNRGAFKTRRCAPAARGGFPERA